LYYITKHVNDDGNGGGEVKPTSWIGGLISRITGRTGARGGTGYVRAATEGEERVEMLGRRDAGGS